LAGLIDARVNAVRIQAVGIIIIIIITLSLSYWWGRNLNTTNTPRWSEAATGGSSKGEYLPTVFTLTGMMALERQYIRSALFIKDFPIWLVNVSPPSGPSFRE